MTAQELNTYFPILGSNGISAKRVHICRGAASPRSDTAAFILPNCTVVRPDLALPKQYVIIVNVIVGHHASIMRHPAYEIQDLLVHMLIRNTLVWLQQVRLDDSV